MQFFREIGKAFFVGSIIFIVIGVALYLNGDTYENGRELLVRFAYNQLWSVSLYLVNAYYFRFLLKRYSSNPFKSRHFAFGIIGMILISLGTIFFLRVLKEVVFEGTSLVTFFENERIEYYYLSMLIATVVTFIFYAFYYYRYIQDKKVKEQKIIAKTASAQFDALKNQLDPHFLFNSLNVLTSLIEENPVAATKFTTALSKVYRYVLEQKNKELVTLEEELRFAKLYMSLIKMRFEDSIVFEIPDTIQNPEAKVVPLSLQLLLENAVKHNQVTASNKLRITIEEQGNELIIKNNLQPKKVIKASSGVGLQNIHQRYQLLTQRPVKVEKDPSYFWVTLPLLSQQTNAIVMTQTEHISGKRYERAKEKVEKLKGFYIHLTIYLLFIPVFIYLNIISTSFPWAIFPIIGWGLGVSGHALEAFDYNPLLGRDWEERKIRELMNKDN